MVYPFTVVTSRPEIELTSSRSISQLLNFKNTSDHAISLVRRESEISLKPMDLLRNYYSCVSLIGTWYFGLPFSWSSGDKMEKNRSVQLFAGGTQ
jgi:hypothetical protein